MECVDACEVLDASDPSRADAGVLVSTGGQCPEPPFPCERMCWELDARFGRGRPTTLASVDATDDTNLAAIGEPYMRCAQARAAECRASGGLSPDAGPPSGDSEDDVPPALATSWTGLFLECAGLPVDFEMFFD